MRVAELAMLAWMALGGAAGGRLGPMQAGVGGPVQGPVMGEAAPDTVMFAYVPRDTDVLPWEMSVSADGSGSYRLQRSETVAQPVHVSEATWGRLTGGNAAVSAGRCESRQKVAQTGAKTVSITRNGAAANCTFNYSDDAALNAAANTFIGLAETLHMGEKLQHDHRFDRLALDSDMDVLESAVNEGRALEVGNIAPVLLSVVADDRVIDRARRKAARLLQGAGVAVPATAPSAR